jgi:uncharacterized membrane protein YeiB
VWTALLLASGLFVLATLFIRAAGAASARVKAAPALAIVSALLIATIAGRTIILRISSRGPMRTALRPFVHASLLPQILFVCHIYSSPLVS